MKKINQRGLKLIKEFEGCRLKAYQDIVGVWTIGYGMTKNVTPGKEITQLQAEQMLLDTLIDYEMAVMTLVTNNHISENQFSALVCFVYNVGKENFKKSTLLRCVNKFNLKDAAEEFVRWNKAGGQVVDGLTRRRLAERALFLTPDA